MKKFDIHNHILPQTWPNLKERYGYGGWMQLDHGSCSQKSEHADMMRDGQFFRRVNANCWNTELRLQDMDRDGITVQALSTVPVMFNYWAKPEDTLDLCRFLNDDLASSVLKNPKRFVGLGTLPLQAPLLAVEEMKRVVSELKMPGFQIGSHVGEWNLDAPELFPIYKSAEDLNVSLFVHPWDMPKCSRSSKYWLPWLVGMPSETSTAIVSLLMGGILERFPKLKICFAHGAGSFPYTLGRIQHGYSVRPDYCGTCTSKSPKEFLGQFYSDSLVHDPRALHLLLDVIGKDKVMLGTDYPFPLGEVTGFNESYPGKVIDDSLELSESVKKQILFSNALEFLNLDPFFYDS